MIAAAPGSAVRQHIGDLRLPALVIGKVHHTRHRPTHYSFTHRHYQWLIDLDDPPRPAAWLRPFTQFRGSDHLSGQRSLGELKREAIELVAGRGVATSAVDRVLMLAHARVLGHAFDPLTAFWLLDAEAQVIAVLVEVHNTYGGRHVYVVAPDERGQTGTAKEFYVSPFNDVEGDYALSFHLSADRLAVAVRLAVDGDPLLTATITGRLVDATPRAILATALRQPLMPQRVSALIRWHGIRLWLKRLPVRPRPATHPRSLR